MSTKFQLSEFLPYLLNQAAEAASAEFAQVYKSRYGLLRTDWRVLFHLGGLGEMTARDIAQKVSEDKTRISRAVARLDAAGFIHRTTRKTDRRVENLSLTLRGEQVYRDLAQAADRHDKALAARIGPSDFAHLQTILSRIANPD